MKQVQVTTLTPTSAIFAAMFTLLVMLTQRAIRNILLAARSIIFWLNTKHEFGFPEDPSDETESIKITGWKFLGYGLSTCVAVLCFLLIKF